MPHRRDYKSFLKDVIYLLRANILDLREKRLFADEAEKEYIAARLFSYNEIVASIKSQIKEYNISEEEVGLNDLDGLLM